MDTLAPTGSYLTPSLRHATAGDAMRPRVLTCTPDTPLITVAQRMSGEHVHALVVLPARHDGDGHPMAWAVLTDRDLLHHADRAEELTAGEIASSQLLEVRPDAPLSDVARRMSEQGMSHALVTDPATGRPVGVVSTLDIAGIVGWGRA
jgi:CBS domain-containing protein